MKSFENLLTLIEKNMDTPIGNYLIDANSEALANFEKTFGFVPSLFEEIYSKCDRMEIDFFVGLRLLPSDIVINIYNSGYQYLKEYGIYLIPFMRDNYANLLAYVRIANEEYTVYLKKGKCHIVSKNIDSFWETVYNLYDKSAYYYKDGRFSINFEKLSKVYKETNNE